MSDSDVRANDADPGEPAPGLAGQELSEHTEPAGLEAVTTAPPVEVQTLTPVPVWTVRHKHSVASRWMHWVNFPLLATMIWSGLLIYWADSDPANKHAHQVYRIGLGSWTLVRFFPDWLYQKLHLTFSLANGLGWHFLFMWMFGVNGILYVLYTIISGEWRELVPNRQSFKDAWLVLLHDLHLRKDEPPVRKYNGAQQIAYTAIILSGAGSLITGLAIYKPTQLHFMTSLLGGYEAARWEHFWLMMGYLGFFVIHLIQVGRAGWNNFRSMVTGYEILREERVP